VFSSPEFFGFRIRDLGFRLPICLSFFLGWRTPNLISGLSGWCAPVGPKKLSQALADLISSEENKRFLGQPNVN